MAKKTYIKKQSIKEEKSIVNNILEKKNCAVAEHTLEAPILVRYILKKSKIQKPNRLSRARRAQ